MFPELNRTYICFTEVEGGIAQLCQSKLHILKHHSEGGGHSYISQQIFLRKELRSALNLLHLY